MFALNFVLNFVFDYAIIVNATIILPSKLSVKKRFFLLFLDPLYNY
jgi:hypothetical protein